MRVWCCGLVVGAGVLLGACAGDWPGGARDDRAGPGDGGDRPSEDVVTAGDLSDHHDPADARDDADHGSSLHDHGEAPDDPAPHSHPETLMLVKFLAQ